MKKIVSTVFFILLFYLLQTTAWRALAVAGVVPNLFIILLVVIGYRYGKLTGMLTGLTIGLFLDFVEGDVLGLYAMYYMIIGYLNGFANKIYFNDQITIPLFLTALSDFCLNFVVYVVGFLLRNRLHFFFYFRTIILPELLYTVIVAIFLYRILHRFYCFLEQSKEKKEA